ncbi:MAG: phospho-N-acetylmuramoyl-pentapeptide-transferase [Acidimicrobiales bacterium]
MIDLFVSGGAAMLVAAFGTSALIYWLKRWGIGQQIREDGPEGHITKAGTPTMGGIAIVAATVCGYLAGHLGTVDFTRPGVAAIVTIVAAGVLGFGDDWAKVRHRRSLGLSKRAKAAGQAVVALGFVAMSLGPGGVSIGPVGGAPEMSLTPAGSIAIAIGPVAWALWAVFVITGSANAVNLTDGLDGLAAGSAAFAFSCLTIIGYWEFRHLSTYHVHDALDMGLVAVSVVGSCAGFLWWNAAPARIMMGDTGSLALGAGMATLALEMGVDLLLPVIGGLFVIVTLSVLIQVVSFRVFGRRVFKMAPLHHHFELMGWPETTVIVRFWIISGLFTALGLGIFYAGFIALPRPG